MTFSRLTRFATILLLAGWAGLASQAGAQTTNIIQDNFTGASAMQNWDPLGQACLTAGSGAGSIPACTSITDAVGSGALRLTDAANSAKGAILSNWTFPSNAGIQVTFTTYTYGGNSYTAHLYGGNTATPGADGIGFYLLNGSVAPNIGAFGGSLGYSCSMSNNPHDGMAGAYLGVGMDEYGNFTNGGSGGDNTATGTGHPGYQNPNEIGVRGWGNVNLPALQAINPSATESDVKAVCENGGSYAGKTLPDYPLLGYYTLPSNQPISNESATKRSQATPITYQLIITPGGNLNLSYKYGSTATTFSPLLKDVSISGSNGPMPSSFRFGFGASTGGGTNVHEITCFSVVPANQTVGAPVAPLSIGSGSYIYTLTSALDPIAGHVQAYSTSANGTPAASATWDVANNMTAANRATNLYSTKSDNTTPVLFANLDSAAFALSNASLKCVPNTQTIINYTENPGYTWSSMPSSCPSYLGARQSGSYLGEFSQGDAAALLLPASNPLNLVLPGYVAYASSMTSRPQALLFTNNDGFLYSVASTGSSAGTFNWGWMPRPFASQLQNYATMPTQGIFDGKFRITDAVNASGQWGTYVIGSAESGAYWYDLKLDANGNPSKVINLPAMPAGSRYPQRQAPVVATVSGSQIGAFVVNTGSGSSTVSTLYEFNVATGSTTSAVIPSTSVTNGVSSNLFFDAQSNQLYFGDGAGNVYVTSMTGLPATDVANITSLGTTQDGLAVKYLGFQLSNGMPYLWAASTSGVTVFGVSSAGWQALWASNATSGYIVSAGAWVTTNNVPALQATAQISDMPVLANNILVVPVYVPAGGASASCGGVGSGYYDFFSLITGKFPTNQITDTSGTYVNANYYVGQGPAYSPTISISNSGLPVFGGSQEMANPNPPLMFSKAGVNAVVQWREH
ncbi:MAG: hypothetical protein HIU89_12415 [Proteobacteria bacterium]|nr:hypothetical protein [Pseudomonadota bacterium]